MKQIEQWQFKKIYAIGNQLGMVGRSRDDELHTLVAAITGKESLKSLSFSDAGDVITELEKRQGDTQGKNRKSAAHTSKPGGITPAQQKKVWALIGELEKWDREPSKANHRQRLCGAIKSILTMDAAPSDPFRWITMEQGIRLINGLKTYATHAEKRTLREGGAKHG